MKQLDVDAEEVPEAEEVFSPSSGACRICYEHELEGNELLHPCKCSGSVRYIHEECLKAWLVSRDYSLDKGECELCHTRFKMKFTIVSECSLTKGCREKSTMCVFVPLLFLVMAMLGGIVYVLSAYYLAEAKSSEEQGYASALIFICVFAAFVLCALITYASKQSCIINSLQDWQILSIEEVEEISRLDQSKDQSGAGRYLMHPSHKESNLMVLPTTITVKNLTLRTPQVRPNLASMAAEGNKTVFIPPRIAHSLNITPAGSRFVSVVPTMKHCNSTPTISSFKVAPTLAFDASTKRCEDD